MMNLQLRLFFRLLLWIGALGQGWVTANNYDKDVIQPKMNARVVQNKNEAFGRRRRRLMHGKRDLEESSSLSSIQSNFAVFTGYCSSEDSVFNFPLSAGSGKGMAIMMGDEGSATNPTILEIQLTEQTSNLGTTLEIEMDTHRDPLSFGIEGAVSEIPTSWGTRFYYQGVGNEGTEAQVLCPTVEYGTVLDVVVFVRDDSNLMLLADIHKLGDGSEKRGLRVELQKGVVTKGALQAKIPVPKGGKKGGPGRRLMEGRGSTLFVSNEAGTGIDIELDSQEQEVQLGEKVFIQVGVNGSSGEVIYRTLVAEVSSGVDNIPISDFRILPFELTEHGDILIQIEGLNALVNVDHVHLEMRLGIAHAEDISALVDLNAIVPVVNTTLVLNSGWIRRALAEIEAPTEWDLAIISVEATDLDDSSKILVSSSTVQIPGFSESSTKEYFLDGDGTRKLLRHVNTHRSLARNLLNKPPSPAEIAITEEMRHGRKPASMIESFRRLSSPNRKKILIHGYCATKSPFPADHFTDALHFEDPDGYAERGWSHDLFARKISQFSKNNKVDSCACIGHSQGGFACLYLHAFYWSCLDSAQAGGTRLLQSVGTPYLGTPLAAEPATIGEVFGYGCGRCEGLTYDGAKDHLASISPEVQAKMYYYTTSFQPSTNFWEVDYCHALTDILLDDPDDGVTEKWSGQLPSGKSAGFGQGECHTENMKFGPQCHNYARNREMNSKAIY